MNPARFLFSQRVGYTGAVLMFAVSVKMTIISI